jgi:hypothetical protein
MSKSKNSSTRNLPSKLLSKRIAIKVPKFVIKKRFIEKTT